MASNVYRRYRDNYVPVRLCRINVLLAHAVHYVIVLGGMWLSENGCGRAQGALRSTSAKAMRGYGDRHKKAKLADVAFRKQAE